MRHHVERKAKESARPGRGPRVGDRLERGPEGVAEKARRIESEWGRPDDRRDDPARRGNDPRPSDSGGL